jgi:hypothetical protein
MKALELDYPEMLRELSKNYSAEILNRANNGPAVEGVNVTRRSHPATSPGSSAGICPGG